MLPILGLIFQLVLVYGAIRCGGYVSDRLWVRSKWMPLALAGAILAAILIFAIVVHPPLAFVPQTIIFCLVFFAGALAVRSRQRFFEDC